jgi:hypothetical protein
MKINTADFYYIIHCFFKEQCNLSGSRNDKFIRNIGQMPVGRALFLSLPGPMQSKIRGTHWDIWDSTDYESILNVLSYLSVPNKAKVNATV